MAFNWIAIIIGTLVYVLVGSLLYNPVHAWGRKWGEWSGMTEKMKDQKMSVTDMIFTFGGTLLAGIFLSIAMTHVATTFVQVAKWPWMLATVGLGLLCWLGFYGPATFVMTVYNGGSRKLAGLHLLNGLISLLIVGLAIGFFPL